ncbi:NAD-dependent formate dehydrogenase [Kineococcus sp. R8]|nr:NAD-dependent formate dehydrogenase [Kineococcus siccus]NAZ82689.1 NAD-dependent formate dehydrogenase [Kineococcus siccus]
MSLYPAPEGGASPELLGCAENALGLREWLEGEGHELVSTSVREGDELTEELRDAEVLITTPFWPVYASREVLEAAPGLKLILTAGVGSDHVDLRAAADRGILVAEQTGSNVVSVAEHAVMQLLALVRNYVPAHQQVVDGRWDIGEIAQRSWDLERKTVGIYGAGAIGQLIGMRLKGFDVETLYYKRTRLEHPEEAVIGARYARLDEMQERCDAIVITAPLTPETEGLFDREVIGGMKRGAFLVNVARGGIVDTEALVEALESGQLNGYAGDVWYPEPAPTDHPWRRMPHHMLTPHVSGTTLDAQRRYAADTRHCLDAYLGGQPIEEDHVIVADGEIIGGAYAAAFS